MTATPKAETGANNLDYFGEPIFTYSLLQGIQDGFLAPYRVTNSYISIDLQGFKPEDDSKRTVLKELKVRGASHRQLERLTGVGRGLIQKL